MALHQASKLTCAPCFERTRALGSPTVAQARCPGGSGTEASAQLTKAGRVSMSTTVQEIGTDEREAVRVDRQGDPLPQSEAELLQRLREKVLEIAELENSCEAARNEHKEQKDLLAQAKCDLVDMIRGHRRDEPLVDMMEPDGWKRAELSTVLGSVFAAKIQEKAGGVLGGTTLGHLQGFLELHRLTDIRGIGPAVAEKIEAKMEAFWGRHPEWCGGQA